MKQFAFLISAQEEYLCLVESEHDAIARASAFLEKHNPSLKEVPYTWIKTAEENVYRISVGV